MTQKCLAFILLGGNCPLGDTCALQHPQKKKLVLPKQEFKPADNKEVIQEIKTFISSLKPNEEVKYDQADNKLGPISYPLSESDTDDDKDFMDPFEEGEFVSSSANCKCCQGYPDNCKNLLKICYDLGECLCQAQAYQESLEQ